MTPEADTGAHARVPHLAEDGTANELERRFERLFRRHAPYVRRVMPRMGVRTADLDDAVQEVFLAVYRGLPGFEQRSSDRTWVYGICIRVCSNYRRRAHRRHERLEATPPEPQPSAITPESNAVARDALARLDAALDSLSEPQRAAFVLHEVEGLSVSEIAEALDCSKFTVYARLSNARRRIRKAMREPSKRNKSHA